MHLFLILLGVLFVFLCVYTGFYFFLRRALVRQEKRLLSIFFLKIAKIPALIEVMRPYVADPSAFDTITELHSRSMVQRYDTIYDLLEHNARIEHEFLFLMQLSMRIPELQKNEQFLYMRDFIIQYERDIRGLFSSVNQVIAHWNQFIHIKNMTIVGLILPGRTQMPI